MYVYILGRGEEKGNEQIRKKQETHRVICENKYLNVDLI